MNSATTLVITVLTTLGLAACGGNEASPTDDVGAAVEAHADEATAEEAPPAEPTITEKAEEAPVTVPVPEDVAAAPADATKTPSGLAYKVLTPGSGADHPTPSSKVTVHYSGWTTDGKMFDSSVTRGQTISFPLNGVIAGWTEGVQLMVPGDSYRFWIPEEMAYKGSPGKPAGMLVFDVELLEIQ